VSGLDAVEKGKAESISLDSSITANDFYKHLGFVDSAPMTFREIGGSRVTCFPMVLCL
jgi:hypothetical protein